MADRNEMTDERAWMIGAIVGAVAFVLLWLLFFGFLGSLFLGAIIGLIVAIILLMRGRPGSAGQTYGRAISTTVADGTTDADMDRTGARGADLGAGTAGVAGGAAVGGYDDGASAPARGGAELGDADGDVVRASSYGSTGPADAAGGSEDRDAGLTTPSGFASTGTIGDEASTGTPVPGGSEAPIAGDEDGAPGRDHAGGGMADVGRGADAGAPLRTEGDNSLTSGAMGGYGRDDDTSDTRAAEAGMTGAPGGAGTAGDAGAMGGAAMDDGTAGVADASLSDPSAVAGEGFDRGRSVGSDLDVGDTFGNDRTSDLGVDETVEGDDPGAIQPGERMADIIEEEESPDEPSPLDDDVATQIDDPAAEAVGDTSGMPSATADPMAADAAEVGTRPQGLDGPRGGTGDDLKMIKGVGPKLEDMLNGMGIYHFDQVASWGPDEVAWCDSNLKGFKGRVTRDDWVEQAKVLASGAETEFSRRAERDDIYGEDG